MTKRKYRRYKPVMKSASKQSANCYITLIKDMELLILLKLKWDIMVPTSKDFLLVLIKKLQQRKIVKNDDLEGIKTHANTFIDLILLGKSIRRTLILWSNRSFWSMVPLCRTLVSPKKICDILKWLD